MKGYATRNKRNQLNIKYRWRGMAKTNYRKQNKRGKNVSINDVMMEYTGTTFNPVRSPEWCDAVKG